MKNIKFVLSILAAITSTTALAEKIELICTGVHRDSTLGNRTYEMEVIVDEKTNNIILKRESGTSNKKNAGFSEDATCENKSWSPKITNSTIKLLATCGESVKEMNINRTDGAFIYRFDLGGYYLWNVDGTCTNKKKRAF